MKYTLDEILASIDEMKKSINDKFKELSANEFLTSEERKNRFLQALIDKLYEITETDKKESIVINTDEYTNKLQNLSQDNRNIIMKILDLEQDKQDRIFEQIDEMIKN